MPRTRNVPHPQAEWLAAIGEPNRLALIYALVTGGKTVTNLARELGAEVAAVSLHLKLMKRVGLVTVVKAGLYRIYGLSNASVTQGRLELFHPSGTKVTLPLE